MSGGKAPGDRWLDQPAVRNERVELLRRWLFWVLVIGLSGTAAELLLLQHYEDPWQVVPLVLIALAIAALARHRRRGDSWSLRTLQVLMALCLAAGVLGVALHFDGAAEFQREIDPGIGSWDLVKKGMRAKAPPVLAPGVMLDGIETLRAIRSGEVDALVSYEIP